VVVGNFGFEMKMDYTVIGDTVNNVFRLQGLTKSIQDGILIGDSPVRAAQSPLIFGRSTRPLPVQRSMN